MDLKYQLQKRNPPEIKILQLEDKICNFIDHILFQANKENNRGLIR